ncbi:MCE family protein [Marmoricola sp. RAF53]|uniref:MCE family protein n=1 Tax=Marmoricola sp. RAF53 TaxID=3233059 RepID=UPI003F9E13CF
MIAGYRSIVVKFTVFAVVAILLGVLLVNTMLNGLNGSTHSYRADFTDVAGLRAGDDMRVAGVRVGRVQGIKITDQGAQVTFDLVKDQPILDTTRIVMRYQNLLGQRYLALVQGPEQGAALDDGATVPLSRTSPGFDLTELLNGFRPLFEALRPDDVNALAGSLVKVLQGEGGTVDQLLQQTSRLTNFLADRDQVVGEVLTNLTPVLSNIAGQGDELKATVVELRALMTGLARDRKSIGASIDGVSQLIGSTSQLLQEARVPTVAAVGKFHSTMSLFLANKQQFVQAISSFGATLAALGRASSYQTSVNLYLCSVAIDLAGLKTNLNGTENGPWSEVCR